MVGVKYVYCTFQRGGVHQWNNASGKVEYLRNLHHHYFFFKVWVSVDSDDREIEFILLRGELESFVNTLGEKVGSCEMMIREILNYLRDKYPHRKYKIDVSEEGINGAYYEGE
jgi:hypothetical protein